MTTPEHESAAITQYFETLAKQTGGLFRTQDLVLTRSSDIQSGGIIHITPDILNPRTFSIRDQVTYLWNNKHRSVRSRLMQAGIMPVLDFSSIETGAHGIVVPCTLTSLTQKPITHIPEKMDVLRLFHAHKGAQATDREGLQQFARNTLIPGEDIKYVVLEDSTLLVCLPASSQDALVPQAEVLNLEKILQASNRLELDQALMMQKKQVSGLKTGDFYVTETYSPVTVPENSALIIYEDPLEAGSLPIIPHQPSPLVDPGFRGSIRFEHVKGTKEELIDDRYERQYVPFRVYNLS